MKNLKRNLNILRKTAVSGLIRLLLQPMKLLPVRKNRVLFISYLGKQYSCNPKAISEQCLRLYGNKLEIGWVFRKPEEFAFLKEQGIRILDAKSFSFIRYALTARVIVTNGYYKPSLPRRKKQFYLRTWHGGGAYKAVGSMMEMGALERLFIGMQQSGADLYLSSSKKFTRETIREAFGYKGEVLEAGMPRNDALVTGAWKEIAAQTKQELGIPEHIALYAPTYREDSVKSGYELNVTALRAALTERFGYANAVPTVSGGFSQEELASSLLPNLDAGLPALLGVEGWDGGHAIVADGYGYVDSVLYVHGEKQTLRPASTMKPLLCAADVLITDYSSSMWDMSLMKKPVFLYCTDLSCYISERDFFTPIREWPYPMAENNAELNKNIRLFDEKAYEANVKTHHETLGNCESGHAARDAAEWIVKQCK